MSLSRLILSATLLAAMSAAAAAKPVTLSAETNLRKAPGTKSYLAVADEFLERMAGTKPLGSEAGHS